MTKKKEAVAIVERLEEEYEKSVSALRTALKAFLTEGKRPDPSLRDSGAFAYPELRLTWSGESGYPAIGRAYARLSDPGVYTTTVTRPAVFRDYLVEQLSLLIEDFKVEVEVGRSFQEIPFPYVLDGSDVVLDATMTAAIARWFPTTDLAHIGDEISDGLFDPGEDFPAVAVRRPAHRLLAGAAEALHGHAGRGRPVLYPVHQLQPLRRRFRALGLSSNCAIRTAPMRPCRAPAASSSRRDTPDPEAAVMDAAWKKHQMPAYHLTAPGSNGVTLVNIGVGPSNAKTICDHLAVTRPHVLADDRSLWGLEAVPDHRRLCPGPRLSARRPCAGCGAAAGHPHPLDRRGPARPL